VYQLGRSIAPFLFERDCLDALTVAGATGGILVERLQADGRRTAIDDPVDLILSSAPVGATAKQLRDRSLNVTNNLLKHRKVSNQMRLSIPLEAQPICGSSLAIESSVRMRHEREVRRMRFVQWVHAERHDLIDD